VVVVNESSNIALARQGSGSEHKQLVQEHTLAGPDLAVSDGGSMTWLAGPTGVKGMGDLKSAAQLR
jgi:hypothetical protein